MSKYSEELKVSQGSWKMCTQCGFTTRAKNDGTKKMREHFQKEHSDLKKE
jgi:hypothetical protein